MRDRPYVSLRDFKKTVRRDRKAASHVWLRKESVIVAPQPIEHDAIRFCITTAGVDREKDTISLDGWEVADYLRNPVVLWGHDADQPPIGRSIGLFREATGMKADVQFVPADIPLFGPRAEGIRRLCAEGFLYATSVGFRPLEWQETQDEARGAGDWFCGIDFLRQELMEFSIVSIPANPEALIELPGEMQADPAALQAAAALARITRERAARQRMARLSV